MPVVAGVDGSDIYYEVLGEGPCLLLGYPFTASAGNAAFAPSDLRETFVKPLAEQFRVIVSDYPRGVGRSTNARPELMTRETVATEMLAVADAAGADTFTWWGYSWGAINGLHLATRSSRVQALVAGGWPPLSTSFDVLLEMSAGLEEQFAGVEGLSSDHRAMVSGFRFFYEDVVSTGWELEQVRSLTIPRLTYVGDSDVMVQGGVELQITRPWLESEQELADLGWQTRLLPGGLDHLGAMTSGDHVLPAVLPFLSLASSPRR